MLLLVVDGIALHGRQQSYATRRRERVQVGSVLPCMHKGMVGSMPDGRSNSHRKALYWLPSLEYGVSQDFRQQLPVSLYLPTFS
jgi:hypothetical protein